MASYTLSWEMSYFVRNIHCLECDTLANSMRMKVAIEFSRSEKFDR